MGPLTGVTAVEFAGVQHGPATYCGMLLADLGANVIRIDRTDQNPDPAHRAADGPGAILCRGQKSVMIDLRKAQGKQLALDLVASADLLIEGFRPGVMERMGLGPEVCFDVNPRLVYGRVTGWGQDGPLSSTPGHDINYLALSGALDACGRAGERPAIPVNYVADMGGGGLFLAFGLLAALVEARVSGRGQVVDAAMLDGAISQQSAVFMMRSQGQWRDQRGTNMIDSGAPFYDVYETADRKYVAVGAIEPKFFAGLCHVIGWGEMGSLDYMNDQNWPELRERLTAAFMTKTRDEWMIATAGIEACISPVLSIEEAAAHPHNRHRASFSGHGALLQSSPAPRFSRTHASVEGVPPRMGQDSRAILATLGLADQQIDELVAEKIVALAAVPQ